MKKTTEKCGRKKLNRTKKILARLSKENDIFIRSVAKYAKISNTEVLNTGFEKYRTYFTPKKLAQAFAKKRNTISKTSTGRSKYTI